MTGRNLPGRIQDLITEGVSAGDLQARGDGAVEHALVRVAMSAIRHEWTWATFNERVSQRCCSHLGTQASRSNGKPANLDQRLRRAWATAERRLPMMREPFAATDVPQRIDVVRAWLDVVSIPVLSDEDRLVLAAACDIGEERNTDSPCLPWRKVAERTGLNPRRTRDTLESLDRREILPLVERGVPRGPNAKDRARSNRYRLPVGRAVTSLRLTTSVDRIATSVDHDLERAGPMPISVDRDLAVVSFAVTGTARAVRAALEELARHGGVAEPADLPDNVVPIRKQVRS